MFSFPIKRLKGEGEWMKVEWSWGENNERKRNKRLEVKKKCGKGKGVTRSLLHPCLCRRTAGKSLFSGQSFQREEHTIAILSMGGTRLPHFPRFDLQVCIFMEWDCLFLFDLLLIGIFKGMTVKMITKNFVLPYYLYQAPTKPNFPNFFCC